jgi:hypothetical protein
VHRLYNGDVSLLLSISNDQSLISSRRSSLLDSRGGESPQEFRQVKPHLLSLSRRRGEE